jgi:hypothetical protein
MIAGMFYDLSVGLAGLGAAALGQIADRSSIETVYRVCSFLPLIGLLTASPAERGATLRKFGGLRPDFPGHSCAVTSAQPDPMNPMRPRITHYLRAHR